MNALLQQFFNIRSVREGILSVDPQESLRKTPAEDNMLVQLQIVFGFLQSSVVHHHNPVAFFNTYKDIDGRPVSKSQQQDVDEYFNRTCSELERLLAGTNYSALFTAEFGCRLSNEIKSSDPNYPWFSENPESFLCIPLDVKGKSSLDQALNALVAVDNLEGDNAYMCEKYGRKVDATKRYSIKSLSNMLTFSLKRFDYDVNVQRKIKINDYFSFPHSIDMRPWSQEGLHSNTDEAVSETTFPHYEDWYYQYSLVGILVHNGSADSGHYYSYIKAGSQGEWLEFNDSDVRPFNINNLEAECCGGKQWCDWEKNRSPYERPIEKSAYMLFYQRDRKEIIKDYSVDPTKPKSQLNPEAPVAIPEGGKSEVPVEGSVVLAENIPESQPAFVHGLPVAIHEAVWLKNREFLKNQYLFDPAYFDFLHTLIYLLPLSTEESMPFNGTFLKHVESTIKFVYEILAHSSSQASLSTWSLLLSRIFTLHTNSATNFLLYTVKKIGDDPKELHDHLLKKLLLDCPSERVRIGFVDVFMSALDSVSAAEVNTEHWPTKLEKLEYPTGQSVACLVWAALQMMTEISRTYWMTFRQFWEINYYSAQLGPIQRRYFRDLALVFSDYRQYYMNNSSGLRRQYSNVSIMDEQYHADLRVYIDTLRILVCGSENEQTEELEQSGVQLSEDEKRFRTPYALPGELLPPLEKHHKEDIFDYSFFSSMMEMEYNTEATIQIIQHISWNCPERSKWTMLCVLEEFDKVMQHKQFALSSILSALLSIDDELKSKRVNWALSPFPIAPSKYQTNNYSSIPKTTGLLGHLKNQPKFVIQLLMHLQSTNADVKQYLRDRRSELLWMRDSLVSTLENEKQTVPQITEDADADVIVPAPSRTEAVPLQLLFRSLCGLIKLGGTGTSDNGEVLELLRKMEIIEAELRNQKRENEKMKNSMEALISHYKKVPDLQLPPPEIDLTMIHDAREGWHKQKQEKAESDQKKLDESGSNVDMAGSDDTIVYGPSTAPNSSEEGTSPPLLLTNGPTPKLPSVPSPTMSPEPSDLQSKIASLYEIFSHHPNNVLKIALKHNNWNADHAVMALFDPEKETKYLEEATLGG